MSLQFGIIGQLGPAGGCVVSRNPSDADYDYSFRYSQVRPALLAEIKKSRYTLAECEVVYRLTEVRVFRGTGARVQYAVDVDLLDPDNPEHLAVARAAGREDTHPMLIMDCSASKDGRHSIIAKPAAPGCVLFACVGCKLEWDR